MRRVMFTSTNAARSFIADSSSPSLPSRISEMSTYTIGCVIGSPPIVAVPAQLVIMLHVATLGLALLVMSPPIVQVAALPAEGGAEPKIPIGDGLPHGGSWPIGPGECA